MLDVNDAAERLVVTPTRQRGWRLQLLLYVDSSSFAIFMVESSVDQSHTARAASGCDPRLPLRIFTRSGQASSLLAARGRTQTRGGRMDQHYQPPDSESLPSTSAPESYLYSPRQIAAAAFLGGPIAGCWLLGSNCEGLHQPTARRRSLIWGLVSTLALLIIAFLLPKSFPHSILPAAYTLAIHNIAKTTQEAAFTAHRAAGGPRYSSWRVVGIGLAFLAAIVVVAVGAGLVLQDRFLPR